MTRRSLVSVTLLYAVVVVSPARSADRAVVWLTTTEAGLERELNAHAAHGLRFAAVSDGLPCSLTVMQAPEKPAGTAAYRVVTDRNLAGNFYGTDDIPFTFVSDELNGVTRDNQGNVRPLVPRSFNSLSEAEEENGQSRIYLGIHWAFDKEAGIAQGRRVADYVFRHAFAPTGR